MTEQKEIVIDAQDCVAGRVASYAAKKALQGGKIVIVNSEKAAILGNRESILEKYHTKFSIGKGAQKGPNFSRVPDKLMRRTVRGMLPWKRTKGREAYKRIYCYKGIPEKYKDKEKVIIAKANAMNYITFQEICKLIGKGK